MAYPPLGAQLIVFSGQTDIEKNAEEVLGAVAAAGFGAIECGTAYFIDRPEVLVETLCRYDLKVAGLHGGVSIDLEATLRLAELYDTRDICISGVGGWESKASADYRRDMETFNEMACACAERGVKLHYHNHAYEFDTLDNGMTGMQVILDELDRSVGDLCVDVAWVHIGGQDPAAFLREHSRLVGYVHLKDYTGDRHWVELGQGVVPLQSVMEAVDALPNVSWAVYEQDTSDRTAAESTRISHRYLSDTFDYR